MKKIPITTGCVVNGDYCGNGLIIGENLCPFLYEDIREGLYCHSGVKSKSPVFLCSFWEKPKRHKECLDYEKNYTEQQGDDNDTN